MCVILYLLPDALGVVSLNRNGSVAAPDCALYEVGGNIGEWTRRLHRFLWPERRWHLHVFLLTELMRVARPHVMNCAIAKETQASVHLRLSEQTNAHYTHVCALAGELTRWISFLISCINLNIFVFCWSKLDVLRHKFIIFFLFYNIQ